MKLDEQKFKDYFLGKFSVAEAETFEEEIAASAELTEEGQIAESALVDDFLRDNLSAADRKLFEKNYLVTEARRERVRLAAALWQIAGEPKKTTAAETAGGFWLNWRVAFAACAAILLVGAAVFLWFKPRGEEIVRQENVNNAPVTTIENRSAAPLENAEIKNQNTNISINSNKTVSPTPSPKSSPSPKPTVPQTPTFAAFTLLPGTLRSEGEQFIKLPPNVAKINLRLNLPKDARQYKIYSAVLKTADGETIATFSNLKSLNLTLPAAKLESRTYIIFLEGQTGQNAPESVAEYTFRVRR